MFDNSYILDTQHSSAPAPARATKKTDRNLPTGSFLVPGFPDTEASYWQAPIGSKNAGAIYASVYRIGEDAKTGQRKTFRTFPLQSGGLFANILGCCELLNHFCNEPTISEADRRLYLNIGLDVSEVMYKHLNPRLFERTAEVPAIVDQVRSVSRNVPSR